MHVEASNLPGTKHMEVVFMISVNAQHAESCSSEEVIATKLLLSAEKLSQLLLSVQLFCKGHR